ncbi:uncharacterized protein LOC119566497 [Chelonia mydas]|uniref:uncharacterized protein LOC119566497 n=1 Tax=Chelonia mydas TaxID=8469 RepID=UPI0018A1E8EB|nr:uncharacterized protein LOC119566497 [Chelonia mydas]
MAENIKLRTAEANTQPYLTALYLSSVASVVPSTLSIGDVPDDSGQPQALNCRTDTPAVGGGGVFTAPTPPAAPPQSPPLLRNAHAGLWGSNAEDRGKRLGDVSARRARAAGERSAAGVPSPSTRRSELCRLPTRRGRPPGPRAAGGEPAGAPPGGGAGVLPVEQASPVAEGILRPGRGRAACWVGQRVFHSQGCGLVVAPRHAPSTCATPFWNLPPAKEGEEEQERCQNLPYMGCVGSIYVMASRRSVSAGREWNVTALCPAQRPGNQTVKPGAEED